MKQKLLDVIKRQENLMAEKSFDLSVNVDGLSLNALNVFGCMHKICNV